MVDGLNVVFAGILTVIAAAKLWDGRRRRNEPAAQALTKGLAWFAVTAIVFIPAIQQLLGDVTSVPTIGEPLARSALALATYYPLAMAAHVAAAEREPATWALAVRRWVLGLAVLVLWVAWLVAPITAPTDHFTTTYGHLPAVRVYLLTFLAYLGYVVAVIWRECLRYRRRASDPTLHLSLTLIAAGCLLGLGYVAIKSGYLLAFMTGYSPPAIIDHGIARGSACLGGIVLGVGVAWPAMVDGRQQLRRWIQERRHLIALDPLWRELCAAVPDVALLQPRRPLIERWDPRSIRFRLMRRVVEIRDVQIELRPYLDADVRDQATAALRHDGLPTQDLDATVEAVVLRNTLTAMHTGRRPVRVIGSAVRGEDNLAAEASWLAQVARAFKAAPRAVLVDIEPA